MSRGNVSRDQGRNNTVRKRIALPVIVPACIKVIAFAALLIGSQNGAGANQVDNAIRSAYSGPPVKVTIKLLQTLNIGDDLSITLTDIQQQSETKKFKIWARVMVKGLPEMQIRRAEEGAAITYPEEHGYTIALVKATFDSAKFSITKNP